MIVKSYANLSKIEVIFQSQILNLTRIFYIMRPPMTNYSLTIFYKDKYHSLQILFISRIGPHIVLWFVLVLSSDAPACTPPDFNDVPGCTRPDWNDLDALVRTEMVHRTAHFRTATMHLSGLQRCTWLHLSGLQLCTGLHVRTSTMYLDALVRTVTMHCKAYIIGPVTFFLTVLLVYHSSVAIRD